MANRVCTSDQKGAIQTGFLRVILKEMILKYNEKWPNNQTEIGYLAIFLL